MWNTASWVDDYGHFTHLPGWGAASFVGYCRRKSGRQCFVKFSGSAAIDPVTGDVIAFGVETEYNTEKVTEVLNQRVLAQQYDMVSYIVGDHYGVVIGDSDHVKKGNIFPKQRDGVYSEYIRKQVIPAASEAVHESSGRPCPPSRWSGNWRGAIPMWWM